MSYKNYPGRPLIISEAEAEQKLADGNISVFDLITPTIFGLLEDLVPGSELADEFLKCYENLRPTWVYYPRRNHLVKFAPPFWHRLALVVRNSTLQRDAELKLSWQEIREKFEKAVVAVAGCSVGNGAAHAIAQDLRPLRLKVADVKNYNLNNGNRVRLTYEDFGRNKAIVTAEQINELDPFVEIAVFSEGIHDGNLADFITGTDFIIEETDDPDMKILIREKARQARVPVIMVTDIGSAAQVDVRRFDLDASLPLAAGGVSDDRLYAARDIWQKDLANRDKFFEFAFSLVGHNHLHAPELKRILLKEDPPLFAGVPQLGSTAMAAGGIAAEAVARLILDYNLPERIFIRKGEW